MTRAARNTLVAIALHDRVARDERSARWIRGARSPAVERRALDGHLGSHLGSEVWPDGSSHPVASGRLNTEFPNVDAGRSLAGSRGQVVAP